MERVSVVLPTRNSEDYMAGLLYSVFSQSFEGEIEVLVMDSSDDKIPDIVEMYFQNYNVRVAT